MRTVVTSRCTNLQKTYFVKPNASVFVGFGHGRLRIGAALTRVTRFPSQTIRISLPSFPCEILRFVSTVWIVGRSFIELVRSDNDFIHQLLFGDTNVVSPSTFRATAKSRDTKRASYRSNAAALSGTHVLQVHQRNPWIPEMDGLQFKPRTSCQISSIRFTMNAKIRERRTRTCLKDYKWKRISLKSKTSQKPEREESIVIKYEN